jgi:hypothetical protein
MTRDPQRPRGVGVVLSGQAKRITCENLDDARWIAYLYAARRRPCELILQDAYHRVLRGELIDGNGGAAPDRV